jgi:hypothetical protein
MATVSRAPSLSLMRNVPLNDCPFCRGPAEYLDYLDMDVMDCRYRVGCAQFMSGGDCEVLPVTEAFANVYGATEHWNRVTNVGGRGTRAPYWPRIDATAAPELWP